ncbi:MAG: Flp pilus assembly protein CpaB [Deltaproteobacteria bacterium]|jgi:pilus assembly protein CpaB|nr:Flp pilus assembly protein CpaB [Deltaproteobacteria bacterium]
MRRWKALIPVALALIISVAGSGLLYKWLKSQTAPRETVKVESEAVPVAVAAADLPWGTKIKSEMIKTIPFLKESLPAGYVENAATLHGRVLIAPLKTNEPVTEHRLAPTSVTVGGVSAVIKPGKRAIAVKGDKVIGISGFILPGNRVDVLVTMTDPRTKSEVTKLVLENVPVLATGTQLQENGKDEPAPVDVYTLEVAPEEGEKLALAAARGKLQFALRNITDGETVRTRGATISQTLASLSQTSSKPVSEKRRRWAPKQSVTVEVIKGNEVSKKKMKP